jgi:hypothetical protein
MGGVILAEVVPVVATNTSYSPAHSVPAPANPSPFALLGTVFLFFRIKYLGGFIFTLLVTITTINYDFSLSFYGFFYY